MSQQPHRHYLYLVQQKQIVSLVSGQFPVIFLLQELRKNQSLRLPILITKVMEGVEEMEQAKEVWGLPVSTEPFKNVPVLATARVPTADKEHISIDVMRNDLR